VGDPYARPASFFKIRPGEYVIPKMAQDAFTSSNLLYVLKNLGVETIIFIGGHIAVPAWAARPTPRRRTDSG
jgi:nicotinamidase-related amidase